MSDFLCRSSCFGVAGDGAKNGGEISDFPCMVGDTCTRREKHHNFATLRLNHNTQYQKSGL